MYTRMQVFKEARVIRSPGAGGSVKLSPRKPMPARLLWKVERTVAALESWQHCS